MPASSSWTSCTPHYRFGPWKAKFEGLLSEGALGGRKTYLLKPQTYMNLSAATASAPALRFFKLPLAALVVVHDEIDLAAGKLKVKTGGGDAGQNGLRSITATLGPDYRRVRLGIGHPGDKDRVTGHVLQNFSKDDIAWLKPLVDGDGGGRAAAGQGRRCRLHEQGGAAAAAAKAESKTEKPGTEERRRIMGFKCGIVGLPNVGKSTLFNALTQTAAAQAANYPFCTIEPNVGDVAVPDPRLETLAKIAGSAGDHSHPHHLRGHCRAGARRLQGRRAGQPVPGQHPRSGCGGPCAALFRG